MRSLYLKIFVWFWGATILMVVAAFWVSYQVSSNGGDSRWKTGRAAFHAVRHMDALREAISAGDMEAARAALSDGQGKPRLPIVVMDAGGRDLLGRRIPSWVRRMDADGGGGRAAEAARFVTEHVTAPSGERYRIIALLTPAGAAVAGDEGGHAAPGHSTARAFSKAGRYFRGPAETRWTRLIVAILVSGLVCYLLARYLTWPLTRLRQATRRLARGDLSARAGAAVSARRDEMGALGRDFDAMAERIGALVSSQQRLLGDVSHELRSPLSRLQVALGLARKRAGPELEPDLDRMELEAERLNELIARILILTRLERDLTVDRAEPVELAAVMRDVVEDASYEAAAQNRKVVLQFPVPGRVQGHARLLQSAIENVVRNAVRYTAENTSVEVTMSASGKRLSVSVRDHGPGVPESALGDLFEPFFRVDDARERSAGGYGIGLAITERIVRRHGGSVKARNLSAGGLQVDLDFPLVD